MGNRPSDVWLARTYLSLQAAAGVLWWVLVFVSDTVKERTLGGWSAQWLAAPDLILFAAMSAIVASGRRRVPSLVLLTWTFGITIALAGYALVERRAGYGAVLMVVSAAGTLASTATIWYQRLPIDWIFAGPFKFREAKPASSGKHLRNSGAQLIGFWTFFLLVLPLVLTWLEHRIRVDWPVLDRGVFDLVGPGLFLVASSVGIASCWNMAVRGDGTPLPAATASKLVIAGPYRIVRNPMAVAGGLQTVGVGLWAGSWTTIVVAVIGGVFWHLVIRPAEEADLAVRFGADYDRYRAHVRTWVPRIRRMPSQ